MKNNHFWKFQIFLNLLDGSAKFLCATHAGCLRHEGTLEKLIILNNVNKKFKMKNSLNKKFFSMSV